MSQQIPIYNNEMQGDYPNSLGKPFSSNDIHIRRLFIHTGFEYIEIANTLGFTVDNETLSKESLNYKYFMYYKFLKAIEDVNIKLNPAQLDQFKKYNVARISEDYTTPTPVTKTTELMVSNGPSIFHQKGKSSFKLSLRLIFKVKSGKGLIEAYSTFMMHLGNQIKFYDEKGSVFVGSIMEGIESKRLPGNQGYDVKVTISAIKKSIDEAEFKLNFTDLYVNSNNYTIDFIHGYSGTGEKISIIFEDLEGTNLDVTRDCSFLYEDEEFMASQIAYELTTIYGIGKPPISDYFTISSYKNRITLIPKDTSYAGDITINNYSTGITTTVTFANGAHWAKGSITRCAEAGLLATTDRNGNIMYTFRPNAESSRAEVASIINRVRKYIEKAVRE